MSRDEFTISTKKKLAERVGYKCSNPFCRRMTIGPQNQGDKSINLGEASHICAAAKGGKRYAPNMTSKERKSFDNGIWMCRIHAALIDRDEKYFTIDMLKKWKKDAEKEARNELIGQENIIKCKFRMLIFYSDLIKCQQSIELLKKQRGCLINSSLLPVQKNWEKHLEEISDSIEADVISTLYRIIREIEDFKVVMEEFQRKFSNKTRADMNTVKYCNRYDIFIKRMIEYLTDDFLEVIKFYTQLL